MIPTSPILLPLSEDIVRVTRILSLLDDERDPITRSDLAEELVHEEALLEDSKDRALYPSLDDIGFGQIADDLRRSSEELRGAMDPIFSALHHSVPVDAHFNDEDFGTNIERLCERARIHMAEEARDLQFVDARLTLEEKERLRRRLSAARRGAIDRPHPTHNPIRRMLIRIVSRIDRSLPDTSAQYHPGRRKL